MAERARAPRNGKKKSKANGNPFGAALKDQEEIEKLANARAKSGHNSNEPPDETIATCASHIEAALIEIEDAGKVMQSARGKLSAARKLTKKDCGSKAWADSIEAAIKLKRQASRGATGEIVTEHRQMGRVLKILDCPLGTQWDLFRVAEAAEPETPAEPPRALDPELQGQAAFRNNEPRENNPFPAGSQEHVDWDNGHRNAENAFLNPAGVGEGAAAH